MSIQFDQPVNEEMEPPAMSELDEKFECYGLLEIMGHQRHAGRITNQAVGGCNFVRIDVPEIDGRQGYTKLFGQSAIFGMTITSEEVARRLAKNMVAQPIDPYDLRDDGPKKLPHLGSDHDEHEDYEDDMR